MKVKIVLINGSHIDFEAPEDFIFAQWAQSVRVMGGWWSDNIHVPYDRILFAAVDLGEGQSVKYQGVMQ